MNTFRHGPRGSRQGGFTLIEALIAFVILAGGLMALFRFHTTSLAISADAKSRAQAVELAEGKIEEVRSFLSDTQYGTRMVNGNDDTCDATTPLYPGVEWNECFLRTWTVNTATDPGTISVVVSWTDRENTAQNVTLGSTILRNEPDAAARYLEQALTSSGDPGGGWEIPDPVDQGTDEGVGRVEISELYDLNSGGNVVPVGTGVATYFDILSEGSIEATDDGLDGVAIARTSGEDDTRVCTVPNSDVTQTPVSINESGQWLDVDGNVLASPYIYRCTITQIPVGTTWEGTLTFDPAGNDAVCTPVGAEFGVAFSEDSPVDLQLGIVVLTNNGAC